MSQMDIEPISQALQNLVNQRVPYDPRGRTYAELIAEAMVREALKGNVRAIKEIWDRVEGKVSPRSERNQRGRLERPASIRVISPPEGTTAAETDVA